VVATDAVVGSPPVLLLRDAVDDDGAAGCTMDGFKGDGVCIVSYEPAVGFIHGAEVGV
jgi:hypothetical protein